MEAIAGSMRTILSEVFDAGSRMFLKLSVIPESTVEGTGAEIRVSAVPVAQTSRSVSVDPDRAFSALILRWDNG